MLKWQLTNDKIMQVKGLTFKGPAITIIAYVTPAGVLCGEGRDVTLRDNVTRLWRNKMRCYAAETSCHAIMSLSTSLGDGIIIIQQTPEKLSWDVTSASECDTDHISPVSVSQNISTMVNWLERSH